MKNISKSVFITTILAASATMLQAQLVQFSDGASTASVNLGSDAGMYSWTVGNQSYLTQQWFWYRTAPGAANAPINALPLVGYAAAGNEMNVTYANSQVQIKVEYILNSPSSTSADIMESIYVKNLSGATIPGFSFFQYSNFDLSDSDYVEIQRTISGGPYDKAYQFGGPNVLQEEVEGGTIAQPAPSRYAAGDAAVLLNAIKNTPGLDLANNLSYQGGDAAWAFQWTFDLPADSGPDGKAIVKDKILSVTPVPEPATVALLGLGLAAIAIARRRE